MNDPDAVFFWGDEYWQHVPQFVLKYLDEVANSYDLKTKTNSEAKPNWCAHDYRDAIAQNLLVEDGIKLDNPRKEIGIWYGPRGDGYMRLCYAANLPPETKNDVNKFLDAVNDIARNKGL